MNERGAYQKKLANVDSVRARHKLLCAGLESPATVTAEIAISVVSQRSFCALSQPNKGIFPMALNTIKSLSFDIKFEYKDCVGIGYSYLNDLRIRLHEVIKFNFQRPSTKNVPESTPIPSLLEQLTQSQLTNTRRGRAYMSLYVEINLLIKSGEIDELARLRLAKILRKHNELYAKNFAPSTAIQSEAGEVVAFQNTKEQK